jgi:glycosyltransferase involved in cell wall biosynthesis
MTDNPSKRPIRVLHITDQLSKGGAGRALIGVAKYSTRMGNFHHECISLKTLFDGVISEGVTEGLTVHVAPDTDKIRSLVSGADIIHWHWWQNMPLMRANLPRKPTLVWCAVSGEYPPNQLTREVIDFADVMVVTNPLSYDLPSVRSLSESERGTKVRLIFESADFERVLPVESVQHDTFNIGWIGTIAPGKYHPRYVEMSEKIDVPNVRFLVCGEGGSKEKAIRDVKRLGVEERFRFVGYQNDMRHFLGMLDVYGFPLDEKTFAGGELNLQEVMVAGLPIVILPYGGPKRMILHGYNGLVAYSDREYKEHIEYLYHHPEERERLGNNAREYALKEFGAENAAYKFNQLYGELLPRETVDTANDQKKDSQIVIEKKDSMKRLAFHYMGKSSFNKAEEYAKEQLKVTPDDPEMVRLLAKLKDVDQVKSAIAETPDVDNAINKVIDRRRFSEYKVSAIVSTYNSAELIEGCLKDLCEQTLYKRGDLEIVVIDSASTENEWEIIQEFTTDHEHILAVRTQGRESLYTAWNRAICYARGGYITSANTDDRHRYDALEVLASVLDDYNEVGIAYGDVLKTNRPNETFTCNSSKEAFRWGPYSLEKLEDHCCIGPQPLWRRRLHDEIGGFNEQYQSAADYDFWLRAALFYSFYHVDQVLGLYLDNPQSLEHRDLTSHYERIDVLNCHHLRKQEALKEKPLVSVIIPTYNRPELLALTLESLIDQTYENWEALVINDGGKPLPAANEALPTDKRIRFINLPKNHERSHCRNLGIREACGKYIAFLDDDDVFYRHHIELAVQTLETDPQERKIWYGNSCEAKAVITEGGLQIKQVRIAYAEKFNRSRLLVNNYIPILALVFHRDVFAENFYNEEMNLLEDYDLLIRLSQSYHFIHLGLVTNEFRLFNDRDVATLARHRDQYAALYYRYRHLSAGEWGLQWDQQKFLRTLEIQALELKQNLPRCVILYEFARCDADLLKAILSISKITVYPNITMRVLLPQGQQNAAKGTLHPDNYFICHPDKSWAENVRAAVEKSEADLLVFMSGDVLPNPPVWLLDMYLSHQQTKAGMVVGLTLKSAGKAAVVDASLALDRTGSSLCRLYPDFPFQHPLLNRMRTIDAIKPSVALLSKSLFLEIGGFDPKLSPAAGWIDLCCNIRFQHEKGILLNPFAQVTQIRAANALERPVDAQEFKVLTSRWGDRFLRSEIDWYVQDEFYVISKETGRPGPQYAEAFDEFVNTIQKLLNNHQFAEAYNLLAPIRRIYPQNELISSMMCTCTEQIQKKPSMATA